MHPIVIIASDKDPAIGAAVDGLQAAGFEVRVLNTATAKLVDFLGALAGEDDEEDLEKKPDAPEEDAESKDVKPQKDAAPVEVAEPGDENDPLDPKKMEALISGEPVTVEIVDGTEITLHPSTIQAGAKTFYSLNEAQFAFWPSAISNEPITGGVDLSLNGDDIGHLTKVTFSEEAMNPPVLKIGREWLKASGRGNKEL
jgi:hypothetical protein